jgi:hypothetical protein
VTDTVHTPKPLDRAAKAEALLLRFTAEAHRRKWDYDRGLDGDGVPIKSEAFDALHRLGEEMRVELEKLRALPAASAAVVPAADRAALLGAAEIGTKPDLNVTRLPDAALIADEQVRPADRAALRDRVRRAVCEAEGFAWDSDMLEPDEYGEVADAVLAVLPAPADRAAVLTEAADKLAEFIALHGPTSRTVAGWTGAEAFLRRLAVESAVVDRVAAETPPAETEAHPPTTTWKVESPRRDQWASWGATYDERDWAQERYESATANAPARPFRLVRATTTYTVEAEHTPAVEAQPGKDTETPQPKEA